jgi:F420-dependent oxidoreductase-like protein
MDLGVQIEPQFGFSFDDVLSIANEAEAAGFTHLWVSDHLFLDKEAVSKDCLEAWTLLAALAVRTRRIRIGPMVTAQSYRNPALLAKIAAGVDRMSDGRLEFGLGAGWKEEEYRGYGYDFPPAGVRVTQMIETLEICRRMWTEERATYHGKYHRIDDALCSPKPLQRPLPIWIGGRQPRVMRVAARYAHAFNVTVSAASQGPAHYAELMRTLDQACAAEKRDPRTLLRSAFLFASVSKSQKRVDEMLDREAARQKKEGASPLATRLGYVAGLPEKALAKLREYADLGVAHVNLMFLPYGTEREQIAALAEVTAELRRPH